MSWSLSRRWPANCRRKRTRRWLVGSVPTWPAPPSSPASSHAISGTTIWRWLSSDAIKPWQHRSWIFPRDPDFGAKAARVLDPYARRFGDTALRPDEFVISADEKTSIQARIRKHATTPPAPRRPDARGARIRPRRRAGLPGQPGTCTAPRCSAAAKTPPASSRSTGSSSR